MRFLKRHQGSYSLDNERQNVVKFDAGSSILCRVNKKLCVLIFCSFLLFSMFQFLVPVPVPILLAITVLFHLGLAITILALACMKNRYTMQVLKYGFVFFICCYASLVFNTPLAYDGISPLGEKLLGILGIIPKQSGETDYFRCSLVFSYIFTFVSLATIVFIEKIFSNIRPKNFDIYQNVSFQKARQADQYNEARWLHNQRRRTVMATYV